MAYRIRKILIRLLFFALYSRRERTGLRVIVESVRADPRIPIYEAAVRAGREARRDEAAHRAHLTLGINQQHANLGCELAYAILKAPPVPKKHAQRVA